MPVGKSVVIIGGGVQGCQLAEFLIKRGRKVTIVEAAAEIGEGLLAEDPFRLLPWLSQKGANMLASVTYEKITDDGLVILTGEGTRLSLQADSIIVALPLDPAPDPRPFAGVTADTYRTGDCREPGFMHDAIADGFRVAMTI
jgi:pyruvate/2-oxoglutarate dehydrogenase complex dihydrolipoamide dehydrogenase (E3) component